MEKVVMYKSVDGSIHDTEEDANIADLKSGMSKWYEHNKLLGNYDGSYVDYNDLVEWIAVNKEKVNVILGNYGV